MIITKLEVQKKDDSRVNLYLDDKFYCGLNMDVCIKYGLKKDKDIDQETIDGYIIESEKITAYNKVIKYLKSSLKTRKQLREYLNKKEYNAVTIDYVLDKLVEYGYINDEYYASSYINTYKNKYGNSRLRTNLLVKGVSKDIIDKCLEDVSKEDMVDSLEKVAAKYLKNKTIDKDVLIKLSRFLAYRGYDFDQINSYVNTIKRGEDIC